MDHASMCYKIGLDFLEYIFQKQATLKNVCSTVIDLYFVFVNFIEYDV